MLSYILNRVNSTIETVFLENSAHFRHPKSTKLFDFNSIQFAKINDKI